MTSDFTPPALPRASWRAAPKFEGLAIALLTVGIAALIGHGLSGLLPSDSIALIFLSAVLISAGYGGFWIGLLTAGLAFLGYNFFFLEPRFTLSVTRPSDVVALTVFLLVAGLTGFLTGRMRESADAARRQAAMLETLSRFSASLMIAKDTDDVETSLVTALGGPGFGPAVLLGAESGSLKIQRRSTTRLALTAEEMDAADRVLRHGQTVEATAPGWEGSRFSFRPLALPGLPVKVIGIRSSASEDEEAVIASVIAQGQGSVDRLRLARDAELARQKAEREELKSALLSSLSHDLKTPLATIYGAVTSLRQFGDSLSREAGDDLLLAIEEETGRLTRYVANLLQMTRLQSGLDLQLDWVDPVDVAFGAVARARRAFPNRRIDFDAAEVASLIHADAQLLDQALFNLIDNAVKFSGSDQPVRVGLTLANGQLRLSVADSGIGIRAEDRAHLFDPFFRASDTGVNGTGLGLTIARGVATALGGQIRVEDGADRGSLFIVDLPVPEQP